MATRFTTLSSEQSLTFWSRVILTANPDKCWEWQGHIDKYGYGKVGIDYQQYRAHRLAFWLSRGVDPGDLCVCHKCDNRRCVNPDHLFLGTYEDNNLDRHRKGRSVKVFGEQHGKSKLTESDVREMRRLYTGNGGMQQKEIAQLFGVGPDVVSRVVTRKAWPHI